MTMLSELRLSSGAVASKDRGVGLNPIFHASSWRVLA